MPACLVHIAHNERCMACLGRWDRLLAERLLREGCTASLLAAALRYATAEIDQREREATVTFEAMRAEIEVLRCGDLVPFVDGELAPGRAEAYRIHLGGCEVCQREIGTHAQLSRGALADYDTSRGDP